MKILDLRKGLIRKGRSLFFILSILLILSNFSLGFLCVLCAFAVNNGFCFFCFKGSM